MDKQKEIEGMADLIGHNKYVRTNEQVACILFDEGYRKAEEVRKETANSMYNYFKELRWHFDDWQWAAIYTACKAHGAEVGE